MKCPYCEKEMEKGYIKSSHFIHWGKEEKLGWVRDDIKLVKNSWQALWSGFFAEAYHCETCKKIILSLEDG